MASFDNCEGAWVCSLPGMEKANESRHSVFRWDSRSFALQALGSGRRTLVKQFPGNLSAPWIGRIKMKFGMFQHSEGRDIQTKGGYSDERTQLGRRRIRSNVHSVIKAATCGGHRHGINISFSSGRYTILGTRHGRNVVVVCR